MNPVLEIRRLSKRFGSRRALIDVDLQLASGTTAVLLGANGAGKSTLLRSILGLHAPESGDVRVLGREPLRHPREVRSSIGYVPDQPDAYPWMSARDLFGFLQCQYAGGSSERAIGLAERLGAPLDTPFAAMSRGEGAKVMLAAALAPEPPLVLLDEPCARLAPAAREEVLAALLELAPSPTGTMLVATHDLDVAARLADRVLVLDAGRLVVDERVDDWIDTFEPRETLPAALRRLYPRHEALENQR